KGVLYAGLMLTADGPSILEFNARFGDPETQVILPRLKSDLVDVMEAVVDGKLADCPVEWHVANAVCVVMASEGYPGSYPKGKVISGLDELSDLSDVVVFHAGTAKKDGRVVTSGGRVLGVTALADDLKAARDKAYAAVEKISFSGVQYRHDIGDKALKR
ncbi:MAG: phosphoribosylamine--glycine ligase, partial [bacterium]